MFVAIKNFTINRVLRHVADNAKLNVWTNWLAVILVAVASAGANWVLAASYFSNPTQEAWEELVRIGSVAAAALIFYLMGKFPGLKRWLPVVEDVVQKVGEYQEEESAPDERKRMAS